jgi:arsenate reductase
MVSLYGISNCDSCRKARKWLSGKGVEHEFVDIRESGLDANLIGRWLKSVRWEDLVNRRSQTWRKIPPGERDGLDAVAARNLILQYPSVMKRPLLDLGKQVILGFDATAYTQLKLSA